MGPTGPETLASLKPPSRGAAQLQINIVLDYSSFYHLAQLQRTMNGNICNNYMSGLTKKTVVLRYEHLRNGIDGGCNHQSLMTNYLSATYTRTTLGA